MRQGITGFLVTMLFIITPSLVFSEERIAQISVTGQGSVTVEPDMARITVGVAKQALTASDAVDRMSSALSLVIDALIDAGVAETDVQTSQLRVNPQHNYDNSSGASELVGYTASSSVTVSILDLEKLPTVLDRVFSNGANQMSGLQFDVIDRAPHLEEARRAAVQDAFTKASVYADAAAVSLGGLISLSEGGGSSGPVVHAYMETARSGSVPVMAGEITINAQVNIIYALAE